MEAGGSPGWNSGNAPSGGGGMSTLLPQSLRAAMAFETSPQPKSKVAQPSRQPDFPRRVPDTATSAASAIARADWLPTHGANFGKTPPPPPLAPAPHRHPSWKPALQLAVLSKRLSVPPPPPPYSDSFGGGGSSEMGTRHFLADLMAQSPHHRRQVRLALFALVLNLMDWRPL
jgi:hypothetical protein